MRIKIIFPILLFAGFILLLAVWFRTQPGRPVDFLSATAVRAAANSTVPSLAFHKTPPQPIPLAPPDIAMESNAAPDVRDVDDRIAGLEALAMNNDADSLNLILQSLTDSNPQIRAAALEATIQFRSPAAIPALQDDLAGAKFPQEKAGIQDAIDFLKLPPLAQADAKSP